MGRPKKIKEEIIELIPKKEINANLIITPKLTNISITTSKKRNIVVDKQADNKQIKETWMGIELQVTYQLPEEMSLEEQHKFLDEHITLTKKRTDDYFITAS